MTTLANRPNTALMVIDVQNGVVAGSHDRDGVIGNINALVDKARAEEVPVVWVQHSDDGLEQGSDDWRIVDELSPGDGEPVVQKNYGDSFEAHRPRGGAGRPRRRAGRGHRRAERRVHPGDPARGPGPRLRRHPGRRRAHDRGPHRSTARRAPTWSSRTPTCTGSGPARRAGSGDVVTTGEVSFTRSRADPRSRRRGRGGRGSGRRIGTLQRNPKAGRVNPSDIRTPVRPCPHPRVGEEAPP